MVHPNAMRNKINVVHLNKNYFAMFNGAENLNSF